MNKFFIFLVIPMLLLSSCKSNSNFVDYAMIFGNFGPPQCDKDRLSKLGICDAITKRIEYWGDKMLTCDSLISTFSEMVPLGEVGLFKNMSVIQVVDNPLFVARRHNGTVMIFLENKNKFYCKSMITGTIRGYFKSKKNIYPDLLIESLHNYSSKVEYLPVGYSANCVYTWKNDTYVLKSVLNYNGGNPVPKEYYKTMFLEFAENVKRDSL